MKRLMFSEHAIVFHVTKDSTVTKPIKTSGKAIATSRAAMRSSSASVSFSRLSRFGARLHVRRPGKPCPRWACDRDTAAEAGRRAHDRGCARPDHGRWPEGLVLTF